MVVPVHRAVLDQDELDTVCGDMPVGILRVGALGEVQWRSEAEIQVPDGAQRLDDSGLVRMEIRRKTQLVHHRRERFRAHPAHLHDPVHQGARKIVLHGGQNPIGLGSVGLERQEMTQRVRAILLATLLAVPLRVCVVVSDVVIDPFGEVADALRRLDDAVSTADVAEPHEHVDAITLELLGDLIVVRRGGIHQLGLDIGESVLGELVARAQASGGELSHVVAKDPRMLELSLQVLVGELCHQGAAVVDGRREAEFVGELEGRFLVGVQPDHWDRLSGVVRARIGKVRVDRVLTEGSLDRHHAEHVIVSDQLLGGGARGARARRVVECLEVHPAAMHTPMRVGILKECLGRIPHLRPLEEAAEGDDLSQRHRATGERAHRGRLRVGDRHGLGRTSGARPRRGPSGSRRRRRRGHTTRDRRSGGARACLRSGRGRVRRGATVRRGRPRGRGQRADGPSVCGGLETAVAAGKVVIEAGSEGDGEDKRHGRRCDEQTLQSIQ